MAKHKKNGRPLIPIDWELVNRLAIIQCTHEEIASCLNISVDTLERASLREHKITFAEYYGQKALAGKASLRRRQWLSMEGGNTTMLIWLGKNYLGQSDKVEELNKTPTEIKLLYSTDTPQNKKEEDDE